MAYMRNTTRLLQRVARGIRRERRRGVETVEFSFVFLPFMIFVTVLISMSWAIFVKSALQYAVKAAVRNGITIDENAAGGQTLTAIVKNTVKQRSFGFLRDTSLVHVHYYKPPMPGSAGPIVDVSDVTTGSSPGNSAGNIMVVSVDGYQLPPIIGRLFSWRSTDRSSTTISVFAADLIEQIDFYSLAPLGTAP
jgi:hypothetical protein